ncbi:MAG TPA: transglutaminase-like domain-containing protein [Tetragenococcus sp.]|nr:transglutaminase-like domain-containing protein [Tetragenococcus sp.]
MQPYEFNKIDYLSVPLPSDIQRAKESGDFILAKELIENKLNFSKTSQTLCRRLEGELAILAVLAKDQFPYNEKKVQEKMAAAFTDYDPGELHQLIIQNQIGWIYHQGEKYFDKRFIENLVKTRKDYYQRYRYEEESSIDNERQAELDDNIVVMKKEGKRKAKITVQQSIAPKNQLSQKEAPFLAHLPLPRNNDQISATKILNTTDNVKQIDTADSLQRTIAFQTNDPADLFFQVSHEYIIQADYHDLFKLKERKDFPKELSSQERSQWQAYLTEKSPHILFTNFLKQLLAEIIRPEMNLVQKAWQIYQFVTTQVNYSYMPEYFTITNISEFCAVNQKGDCGVQAILYITLCRMAGIPAKWESGLYISEYTQGPHDWAKFYLPEIGWIYADCSFGGSAYRGENTERWKYYFGNLDVFRLPANDDIQSDFRISKNHLRADPIDNQRGEFETRQQGLRFDQLDWQVSLLDFKFL